MTLVLLLRLQRFCANLRKPEIIQLRLPGAKPARAQIFADGWARLRSM
jgi:hypothetical protein